jgi:stage III sporulation protein AA
MALRSLSPRLLVTDEIGSAADVAALTEAAAAGVRVIATLHGASLEEAGSRPLLRPLLESGLFSRWVRLGRRPGPGAVLEVRALEGGRPAADGRH